MNMSSDQTNPRQWTLLLALLAIVMLATRFHHFGTALNLPDASMAVFFLGGLYLRKHLAFAGFAALALVIDWLAIGVFGTSAFCITPAYVFMLPAYAVLWYGGSAYASRLQVKGTSMLTTCCVAFVCATVSFAISNGAFYWLGGRYADPNMAEYLARAWQWGPLFVRTTMTYVVVAMVVHALSVWMLSMRRAGVSA